MLTLKLLVFIGIEGIYHVHIGQGKFIADMLSQSDGISADVERKITRSCLTNLMTTIHCSSTRILVS